MTSSRRMGWLRAVLGLIVVVVVLAGCGSSSSSSSSGSSGGGSSSSSSSGGSGGGATKTLKVGMVWSLSGAFAPYGKPGVDGVNLAIHDINAAGGVKVGGTDYKLSLKVVDDRSDPQTAVAGAIQLIRDDGVKYLIGPLSGLTPPVAKLAAQANVVHLSAASVASALAGTKAYPLLFGTLVTDAGRCEVMMSAIKQFFPSAHNVAIVGPDDPTGQLDSPLCASKAKAVGLTPTAFPYPAGTTDLTVTMTKVAAAHPDIIIAGWAANDAAAQYPAVVASSIPKTTPIVLFGDSYSDGLKGLKGRPFIASPFVEADFTVPHPTPDALKFKGQLQQFLGTKTLNPLETTAEFFYDALRHTAAAMTSAGSVTDTAAVAKAMDSITTQGITGPTRFVHNNAVVGVDVTLGNKGAPKTVHITPPPPTS
jgi:ABC-type branched-subunit amino acid transport system substrate-binding protein